MTMSDYEIDEIRRIRHQISAEHGHDLRRIAEHYRELEKELRKSGRFKFADETPQEAAATNAEGAV
jgi:hypothetical protein